MIVVIGLLALIAATMSRGRASRPTATAPIGHATIS